MPDDFDDVVYVTPKIYKDQHVTHSDTGNRKAKEHEITRFHLHVYERVGNPPVILVEEAENNRGPKVNTISEHLAGKLKGTAALNLRPDDLVWYEQNKKGEVERVHFCTFNMDLKRGKPWGVVHREPSSTTEMLCEVAMPEQAVQQKQHELVEMHGPTEGENIRKQVKAQDNPQEQQQKTKRGR